MKSSRSDVLYQTLFEKSLNAVSVHTIVLDQSGNAIDYLFDAVNPSFESMTGLSADQVLGRSIRSVLPGTEPIWIERYGKVALTGEPDSFESYSQELKRWYQVAAFRHKPLGFTVTFIDITERVASHRLALDEAEKTRVFLEVPNAAKLIIDLASGVIIDSNPKASEFYGWPPEVLRGMRVDSINTLSPLEIAEEMELARTQRRDKFQFRHRLANGEIREVEVCSSPGVFGGREMLFSIIHDVTDAKLMQQKLLQRERLSAVGQMTASLYHEFGNLLGTLFAQFQLLEREIPDGSGKVRLIGRVQKQFDRAKKLVESVKRFSRNREVELQQCRLSPLLEDLVELETPLCREAGIIVGFIPSADDWVRIDAALLQQVFLNLFTNAVQAVYRTPSPQIFIEVHIEDPEVVVRFGNSGPEIPPEIKPKLFTAFFTTKTDGDQMGTGLGLSFSWTIVNNHGGSLSLEDGPGTVFQVRLPRLAVSA